MNARQRQNKVNWVIDKVAKAAERGDETGIHDIENWAIRNKVNCAEVRDAVRDALKQAREFLTPDYDYDKFAR